MVEQQNPNIKDKTTFNIPNVIKIDKYTYTWKDKLINDYFTYICKKRKECGLVIKLQKTNYKN